MPLGRLRVGQRLGGGGEGQVFALLDHPDLVLKRYHASPVDPAGLLDLIVLPDRLARGQATLLLTRCGWPLASVVDDGGAVVGVLMPRAGAEFTGETMAGPRLRELQYLLHPPSALWGALVPLDTPGRLRFAVKVVSVVGALHDAGLILGDISMTNLLWSPGPDPGLFIIDFDSVQRVVRPSRRSVDTPDWSDPLTPGVTQDSDCYKLALVVARVLAADAYVRPGGDLRLRPDISPRIRDAVLACFAEAAGAAGTRPDAKRWLNALFGGAQVQLTPP